MIVVVRGRKPRPAFVAALSAVVAAIALSLVLGASTASAATPAQAVQCTTYQGDQAIAVALASGAPANDKVAGELCATPAELKDGETVQLLLHGASYNRHYWDFGTVDGESYSYARDAAAAGYPTFAMDQIGAGASSHPLSTTLTIQVAAYVEHEVLQHLKAGAVGGVKFGKVIIVGHSLGSITSWVEGATYHDAAGIVLTGVAHDVTTFTATDFATNFEPVTLDPAFAGDGLDPGYETTVPGSRETLFYNPSDSDPNVIAQDEATKDAVSTVETDTGVAVGLTTESQGIDVPVLLMLGGQDRFFCGAEVDGGTFNCASGHDVANQEASYYSARAQLRACVVPGSGHDINLALNHDLEETDATTWANEYVGQQGAGSDTSRALPDDCSN